MKTFKKLLIGASGAFLTLVLFAGNTYAARCVIRDNGADSWNWCRVRTSRTLHIWQSNHASIFNFVNAEAETGENDANDNTGGDVTVTSGNARVTVTITNTVNQNSTP